MESQHTREMDKNHEHDTNKDATRRGSGSRGNQNEGSDGGPNESGMLEQAKSMTRDVGEQARNIASTASSTAQDLARRAREQTDTLYQQGTQVGEYLTRNVNEYPLAALLVAGAIGYGLGYLIHSGWSSSNDRRDSDDRNTNRRRHD